MAKVKEIKISYGRTVNLGNFESERFDVGMTVIVDDKVTDALLQEIMDEKRDFLVKYVEDYLQIGVGE